MRIKGLCYIVLLCSGLLASQETGDKLIMDDAPLSIQEISESDLEPYTSDDTFNYTIEATEPNALDQFLLWLQSMLQSFLEAIFGVEAASGILLFIIRILPYLLLAFLMFLLLRFFLKVNSNSLIGKSQAKGEVQISEEEQIIKNEDISALIKSAIANGNYRLAIRYHYLLVLKHLSLDQHITWEPQKTNEDYIKEVKDLDLKSDFEKITRIYDYIWYGEFGIDAKGFQILKTDFDNLNSKLEMS